MNVQTHFLKKYVEGGGVQTTKNKTLQLKLLKG